MQKTIETEIDILNLSLSDMREQKEQLENMAALVSQRILENEKKLSDTLRSYYTSEKLLGRPYLFNKPHKWGPLDTVNVGALTDCIFKKNKISPYYTTLQLCAAAQVGAVLNIEEHLLADPEYQKFCQASQFLVISSQDEEWGSHECYVVGVAT